jgi:hypothetical protein
VQPLFILLNDGGIALSVITPVAALQVQYPGCGQHDPRMVWKKLD